MDGTGNGQHTDQAKDAQAQASPSQSGTATASGQGTSPTQEQIIEKAVRDALAKAGRSAQDLDEAKKRLDAGFADLTARQAAWQKQKDDEEEEAVADDMPALTALREKRKKRAEDEAKATELSQREAKLSQREKELDAIVERDGILTRTELAAEIAMEKGVSIDSILKGAKLANNYSRETMVAVAELLPKTKELPTLVSDSPGGSRGGIDLSGLSPREKIEVGLEKQRQK